MLSIEVNILLKYQVHSGLYVQPGRPEGVPTATAVTCQSCRDSWRCWRGVAAVEEVKAKMAVRAVVVNCIMNYGACEEATVGILCCWYQW
jgi:hypothetical protein